MSTKQKIGIVAGAGELPLRCIEAIKARGDLPYAVILSGEADNPSRLAGAVNDSIIVPLGKISKPLSFLKGHGVSKVVLVGGVKRQGLFLRLRPDIKAISLLTSLVDKRDDALLRAISSMIESHGISIVGVQSLLPELTVPKGVLTSRHLSPVERQDALLGWQVLESLGSCDVGQSVVAFEGSIVAIEGIEGTDRLIARAGELCGRRGGVLVKKIKSGQDTRLDNPTIGLTTITAMANAGLSALVLGAGGCVVVNPQAVIQEADKKNIAIEAL